MPVRRPATVLLLAGALTVLTACSTNGLAFRTDTRLTITAPQDRSTVSLPVTLRWEVRDLEAAPSGRVGAYAVFVDTTPVPPGEALRHVARDDDGCREADGCPDADYLRARGVYTTTGTSLVLAQLPRGDGPPGRRERHRATVVLLDQDGRRLGESAFEVVFDLERGDAA